MLVAEDRADHIDLNFGCPVPKVTRKGGGAALPWKLGLFRDIVEGAVKAAGDIPLTIKMRKGIDDDHLTYLEAGKAAEGRRGRLDRAARPHRGRVLLRPGRLVGHRDAEETHHGRAGARQRRHLVGGRRAPHGRRDRLRRRRRRSRLPRPPVAVRRPGGGVPRRRAARREPHPRRGRRRRSDATPSCSIEFFEGDEERACRDIRKHVAWYFKGYPVGGDVRASLAAVVERWRRSTTCSARSTATQPYPGVDAEGPRGRAGSPKRPSLPDRWLESRELDEAFRDELAAAELHHSGG